MTTGQERLRRLTALRSKLHMAASVELRSAHMALAEVEAQMQSAADRMREAHAVAGLALTGNDHDAWLLACAESEFSKFAFVHGASMLAAAESKVAAAAKVEAIARRELRQMECTLEAAQDREKLTIARAEQSHLDETARLLSRHSEAGWQARRST